MTRLELLFLIDPPESIDAASDTTLVCIEEARRRGHNVDVADPRSLALIGADPIAATASVTATRRGAALTTAGPRERRLEEFDAVLMRKDPPFDLGYYHATLVLERARGKTLLVNDPRGLREVNEKLAILEFPTLAPRTIVTRSLAALRSAFVELGGDIVVKPIDRCGGSGVVHLRAGDPNLNAVLELVTRCGEELVMAQPYIPAIRAGDKRILLLDGEPVGAVLRVPASGETRANLHVGGTPVRTELTARDREICAAVGPWCRDRGLALVGIDVIGEYLTEINVTSPTGFRQIAVLDGIHLERAVLDWLESRCCGADRHRRAA